MKPWPVHLLPGFHDPENKEIKPPAPSTEHVDEDLLRVENALNKARLLHDKVTGKKMPNKKSKFNKTTSNQPVAKPKNKIERKNDLIPEQQETNLENIVDKLEPLPNFSKLMTTHSKLSNEYINQTEALSNRKADKEAQFLETVQTSNTQMFEQVFNNKVLNILTICENCIIALQHKEHLSKHSKCNLMYFRSKLLTCIKSMYNDMLEEIASLMQSEIVSLSEELQIGNYTNCLNMENQILMNSCPLSTLLYNGKSDLIKWRNSLHHHNQVKTALKFKSEINAAFKCELSLKSQKSDLINLLQNMSSLLCNDNNLPAAIHH